MGNLGAPNTWLSTFGNGIVPNGNLGFVTGNIIPFVISLLLFLIVVLSLIFLLLGGLGWITSGGNKEGMAKAKGTVTYAIVGLVLGLGSFLILGIIGQLFGIDFFPHPLIPPPCDVPGKPC